MHPAGVQGTRLGRLVLRLPTLTGWKPSTSFSGETANRTAWHRLGGRGSWTRMPSISSRALSCSMRATSSSVVVVSGG